MNMVGGRLGERREREGKKGVYLGGTGRLLRGTGGVLIVATGNGQDGGALPMALNENRAGRWQ